MPNQPTTTTPSEGDFRAFLETAPPSSKWKITDLVAQTNANAALNTPELLLHCDSPECAGPRVFRISSKDITLNTTEWRYGYLHYLCGNCRKTQRRFAVAIHWGHDIVIKIGELPVLATPTPARLISMIGPHRELFLKGRRAEQLGLGVGAFAYYRRVIEGEKGRIIEEIAKVAKALGASSATIKIFENAAIETQFSKAIDQINPVIPPAILINGHNPLTLLHSALSEGLHSENDEECLNFAQHIRVIMVELAERLATALKDDRELKEAVTKLLTKRSQKTAKPTDAGSTVNDENTEEDK